MNYDLFPTFVWKSSFYDPIKFQQKKQPETTRQLPYNPRNLPNPYQFPPKKRTWTGNACDMYMFDLVAFWDIWMD